MKKIKLFLFILITILIPGIVMAKDIDNYILKMNIEDFDMVSYVKYFDMTEETDYTETLIVDKDINIKTIGSSTNYKLEDNDITFTKISNRTSLEYDLSYKLKSKDHREYYLIKNNSEKINKVNFIITIPNSNLNVTFLLNGKEISEDKIVYKTEGNRISGTIYDIDSNSKVSIKLDNNNKEKIITTMTRIALIFPLLATLICYFLWYFFGKDSETKISITSHPPKNADILEIGMALNGEVTTSNIALLLIKLANEEYIKIKEDTNGIKLFKLKDYSGKNYNEALFLRKLFTKNIIKDDKIVQERVDSIYLQDTGIKTAIEEIKVRSNSETIKNKYYEKSSNRKNIYITILTSISLLLINCVPFIEYGGQFTILIGVIFSILCLYVLIAGVNSIDFEKVNNAELIIRILVIAVVLSLLAKLVTNIRTIYIIIYVIGFTCSFLMLILYKYTPKRTKKGTAIFSEIESLRLFIETAKPEELKRVLELDNQYIYSILPYTYLLEDTAIIKKQFKPFKIVRPIWYETKNITSISEIYKKIDYVLNKISK